MPGSRHPRLNSQMKNTDANLDKRLGSLQALPSTRSTTSRYVLRPTHHTTVHTVGELSHPCIFINQSLTLLSSRPFRVFARNHRHIFLTLRCLATTPHDTEAAPTPHPTNLICRLPYGPVTRFSAAHHPTAYKQQTSACEHDQRLDIRAYRAYSPYNISHRYRQHGLDTRKRDLLFRYHVCRRCHMGCLAQQLPIAKSSRPQLRHHEI